MKAKTHRHTYLLALSSGNRVRVLIESLPGNGRRSGSYDLACMRPLSDADVREYHGLRSRIAADLNRLGYVVRLLEDATDRRVLAEI